MLTISQFRHPKYHQLHTLLGFLVGALDPANTDDHTRIVPDLPIPSDQVKNFAITTAQQRVLELAKKGQFNSAKDEEHRLDEGNFHAIANTNASHGYVYIIAWEE